MKIAKLVVAHDEFVVGGVQSKTLLQALDGAPEPFLALL
jgi:hypothetical protein